MLQSSWWLPRGPNQISCIASTYLEYYYRGNEYTSDINQGEAEADYSQGDQLVGKIVRIERFVSRGAWIRFSHDVGDLHLVTVAYFTERESPEDSAVDDGGQEGRGDGHADERAGGALEQRQGHAGPRRQRPQHTDPQGAVVAPAEHLVRGPVAVAPGVVRRAEK